MGLKMMSLIVVDKIRSMLINALEKKEPPQPTNYTKSDFYCSDDARVFVVVDQRILRNLSVFACVAVRNMCADLDINKALIEIRTGRSEKDPVFTGNINLDDILEAAACAEVDHVIDFLFQDDVSLYRADHDKK